MIPATSYTVHHVARSSRVDDRLARGVEWNANGLWASGRGRLDVTTSDLLGIVPPGSYFLFDESSAIVVDPCGTFTPMSDICSALAEPQEALSPTADDATITVETLPDETVVAGYRTRHVRVAFRLSAATEPGIVARLFSPMTDMKSTIDYWIANTERLPGDPAPILSGAIPSPPSGSSLAGRVANARREALFHGSWLRIMTTTIVRVGSVESISQSTAQIADITATEVDEARLVIPPDVHVRDDAASSHVLASRHALEAHWRAPISTTSQSRVNPQRA